MTERIGVNFPKEYWEEIKEELIYLYTNVIMSTYQLAEKYGCTPTTIRLHLKQWGVYDKSINKHKRNEYIDCGDYVMGYTRDDKYEFYIGKKHYDLIKQYCWHKHQDGYLRTYIGCRENGGHIYKLMHVMVMELEGFICSQNEEIDHINGKPNDNRFENLRIASHGENMKNVKLPYNNISGYKGVYYSKRERKWKATIRINKRQKHLGTFDTKDEAVVARLRAEELYYGKYKRKEEDLLNGTR